MSQRKRPPVCRVCSVSGAEKTLFILKNKRLQELYEILTTLKFRTKGRSRKVCHFCNETLVYFHEITQMEKQSRIILKKLVERGQKATPETVKVIMEEMSLEPGAENWTVECIDLTQDDSNDCTDITEQVSVSIERLDVPLDESAVWANND